MSETIKGINVVIGAETTGLQAALADVNKKSRDLQSELFKVEKLLKMDPGNTELIAQKQKLLADAVENTKEKLDRLKLAQKQVDEQFKKGEISEGQYRAFQREVIKAEQELKKLEKNLGEVGQASTDMGKDVDKAGDKINKLGDEAKKAGDKISDIGSKMSMGITAPVIGAMALATEGTEEFRIEIATLETNAKMAGQSMDVLDAAMRKLEAVTGETDSNVEGLSELLATGFKDEKLTELVDALAGASIKFKDTMKFEGIADGLQETLATGAAVGPFGELLERSGLSLDKFNAGLTDAIKNGTQQQYILDVLAKTGLADVYEAYRKNNEELVKSKEAGYEYQKAMGELSDTLVPIITEITDKITEMVESFNKLPKGTQDAIIKIAEVAAVIGPALIMLGMMASGLRVIATVIGPVITGIGILLGGGGIAGLIAAFPALGTVMGAVGTAFTAFGTATGTAIGAVGVAFTSLGTLVGTIFGAVVTAFTALGTMIGTAIGAVGTAFTSFGTLVGTIFGAVSTALSSLGALIGSIFAVLASSVAGVVALVVAAFAVGYLIGNTIMKFWGEDITNAIMFAIDKIKMIFAKFGEWLGVQFEKINEWLEKKKKWFNDIFTKVKETLQAHLDAIKGIFEKFKTGIINIGAAMWDAVFGNFRRNMTAMYVATADLLNLMGEKWIAFKDFMADIWEGITDTFFAFINVIIKFINKLIAALNSIKFEFPDWMDQIIPGLGGKKFGIDLEQIKLLGDDDRLTADQYREQRVKHEGDITVHGVNNRDELIATVDLIWDDLIDKIIKEVRT